MGAGPRGRGSDVGLVGEGATAGSQGPVLQFFTKLRRHASLEGSSPYFKIKKWKLDSSQRASSLDTRGNGSSIQTRRAFIFSDNGRGRCSGEVQHSHLNWGIMKWAVSSFDVFSSIYFVFPAIFWQYSPEQTSVEQRAPATNCEAARTRMLHTHTHTHTDLQDRWLRGVKFGLPIKSHTHTHTHTHFFLPALPKGSILRFLPGGADHTKSPQKPQHLMEAFSRTEVSLKSDLTPPSLPLPGSPKRRQFQRQRAASESMDQDDNDAHHIDLIQYFARTRDLAYGPVRPAPRLHSPPSTPPPSLGRYL